MNNHKKVIFMFDVTGIMAQPWLDNGYTAYCFDGQHPTGAHPDKDNPNYIKVGLWFTQDNEENLKNILAVTGKDNIHMVFGFPECTDLAVSGATWFAKKRAFDPEFQTKAMTFVYLVELLGAMFNCPWALENPVSVISTKWRKPDYRFHPFQYGGYIPYDQAEHPRWPEYIAAKDAYKKNTCLWTGGGFVMPYKISVDPEAYHGNGYSTSMMKLGGKSQRTKDIRSATPRGFAIAVYEANKTMEKTNA